MLKAIFAKATIQSVVALMLTGTLCFLAATQQVSPDAFLGAVVGGAFLWLFGPKPAVA